MTEGVGHDGKNIFALIFFFYTNIFGTKDTEFFCTNLF